MGVVGNHVYWPSSAKAQILLPLALAIGSLNITRRCGIAGRAVHFQQSCAQFSCLFKDAWISRQLHNLGSGVIGCPLRRGGGRSWSLPAGSRRADTMSTC